MANNRVTATVKYNKNQVIGFHNWLLDKAGDSTLADAFYSIALEMFYREKEAPNTLETHLAPNETLLRQNETLLRQNDAETQDIDNAQTDQNNNDWLTNLGAEVS